MNALKRVRLKLENGESLSPDEQATIDAARERILANFKARTQTGDVLDIPALEQNVDRIKAEMLAKFQELAATILEQFLEGDLTPQDAQNELANIVQRIAKIR